MRRKIEVGRFFTAPLLGGGYAHGYFTYYHKAIMALCDVYDLITWEPDVPDDIESHPLILRDLRIGTSEFRLKPHEAEEFGRRWILSDRMKSEPVEPECRYFRMGYDVYDLKGEEQDRPVTEEDKKTLKHAGFTFPPTTAGEIEIAIRRLDVDPDDFLPEDFPRH